MARAIPAEGAPNVLFILTDDQPWHTLYHMQRTVARLVAEGVDYTPQAYTIVPMCGPARVSLFSGVAPHTHGALLNTNPSAYKAYRSGNWVYRDLLARVWASGYHIGYFCKVINGYEDDGGRWVHPFADRWVVLANGQNATPYMVNVDGVIKDDQRQAHTSFFGERAEAYMRARAGSGQPWFCWLNWTDPHSPYTAAGVYEHTHDGERYVTPGTEEDTAEELADKSAWMRSLARISPGAAQNVYEWQLEELERMDAWIGRLLDTLTDTGQLDNTIIIFTTDNGFMSGEHGGLTTKSLPYDGDMRVPLVIRGPGEAFASEAGAQPPGLTSHLDITATILDAAGADSANIDGRSLLNPTSEAGEASWRRRLLVEHPGRGWRVLREGPYQYAELPSGEVELYDLLADPHELENIAASNPDLCAELHGKLALLSSTTGDEFRAAEEVE